ncbi:outer membrane protein assembly factor BamC [Vibrio sp. ZSDZ34]|jgi:outer membrane protein assembly factor BamC|uniref:Outer membrane protein assembly factor BamC n=1 Tax=Vibrio gelatinilyticus TaxID=2893468 RepID=A0A9X2AZF8_9VIBR|nr:outer membrane protein assembly factor BamC [Vibrio gelatinilyticus]MCJ2377757.1 outer membrane protein assembly factor BamC [Vibrio gelatinilyticus]
MKLSRQLAVTSLAVIVLAACSSDPSTRREAKDDFNYLDAPELREWKLPEGAIPQFYPNYEIPKGDFKGGIGREVDIRPPQQVLELIPGARVDRQGPEVTLWLLQDSEADKVWETAKKMLAEIDVKALEESEDRIETDWVSWVSEDEDAEIGSRYELTRFEANNRYGFKMNLIDWREGTTLKPVSRTNKERYNTLMTNLITARYDYDLREEAAKKAQELVKSVPISMGTDRSGLPVIIARTPYSAMWQEVPTLLPKMGFTIEERSQSQGTVKAKYAAPGDDFWIDVGVKPVDMDSGSYTFLFGDLGNRTSINVTDKDGKPVTEALLRSLEPLIATMIKKD